MQKPDEDPEARCDACPLLFCDTRNALCVQTPLFILIRRREQEEADAAEKAAKAFDRYRGLRARNELQKGIAALGLAKYDKRRKPDTPRRRWEREYRRKRRNGHRESILSLQKETIVRDAQGSGEG